MSKDLKTKDVAKAAALLLEAIDNAPTGDLETVETPRGSVDVVVHDRAADLRFHGSQNTVHVRFRD